jgi:hypothetical protein
MRWEGEHVTLNHPPVMTGLVPVIQVGPPRRGSAFWRGGTFAKGRSGDDVDDWDKPGHNEPRALS